MNQTFNEIIEQIKNEKIKFYNSHRMITYYTPLTQYTPKNIDQLIYIIVKNYIINLIDDLNSYNVQFYFKTKNKSLELIEILNENLKATRIYFDIFAHQISSFSIDIPIPEYDEETIFKDYINNLLDEIDSNIINKCNNFNVDEEFEKVFSYQDIPSAILSKLNKDKRFFKNFAKNVKTYRH